SAREAAARSRGYSGGCGSRRQDLALAQGEVVTAGHFWHVRWAAAPLTSTYQYLSSFSVGGFMSKLEQPGGYDTPPWSMTGRPPPKKNDPAHDPTKDKTNMIVYVICGVVAIMALVGIFTKLGLEKGTQMNNVGPGSALMQAMTPYPPLGQVSHAYEQQPQPGKELNKYASLKAVAEKANENFYANRRHMTELSAKGTLPLQPVRLEPEPTNPYSPEMPCQKQNGYRAKNTKVHSSHALPYSSNTIATTGMLKGWEATETLGRRHTYAPKRHSALVEQVNELTSAHSQHYLPPHPYYVTNSKTEVTV
uniref:Shisa family member 9b n=1 Tax=Astyanax mexicanus TaxID=7994 RepID=A0A8B9KRR3_ASTMX